MSELGFVTSAAALGAQSVMIRPQRGLYAQKGQTSFDPIVAQAIVEEDCNDDMEIVQHPVEQGSRITDHAFKHPSEVTLTYLWSNSPSAQGGILGQLGGLITATQNIPQSLLSGNSQSQVSAIYQQMLKIQASRIMFSLYTGKRKFENMLVKSLTANTTDKTENILALKIVCQEILIAKIRVVKLGDVPADQQLKPQDTQSPVELGENTLVDAPALSNTLNSVTNSVSNVSSSLTTSLTQGSVAVEAAAQEAISTLSAVAAEASAKIPGVMEGFSAQITESVNSLTGALAGSSGALPGIVDDAIANIQSAVAQIGIPFEIPLSPTPQMFPITLGGT